MSRAFMVKQAPFKPTDIGGCQLWLDGADTTTLTGNVTSIREKANNVSFSVSGTVTTTTIGSNSSLSFGGASYLFGNINNILTGTSFVVFRTTAVNNSYSPFFTWRDNIVNGGQANFPAFGYLPGGNLIGPYTTWVGVGTPTTSVSIGNSYITSYSWSGTTTNVGFNGATPTSGTQPAFAHSETLLWIAFDNVSYTTVNLGEILLYNTVLGTSQRQQVESYLAQKWGLRQQLPQGHPGTRGIVYPSQPIPTAIYWRYPTPFDPTSLGNCGLWLDAADASTITYSSGSNLSQWRDKSGNGYIMSNNAGTTTVAANSLNSLNTVYIPSGTNTKITNFSGRTKMTFFIVGKCAAGQYLISFNGGFFYAGNDSLLHMVPPSGPYLDLDDSIGSPTPVVSNNAWFIFCIGYDNATNSTANPYTINGSPANGTNRATTARGASGILADQFITNTLYINSTSGTNSYDSDYTAELIYYNTTLSVSQRQQVEGYLAWKWGLQSTNLPVGHTYKNAAPIGVTNPAGISRPANVLPIPSIACFPIRTYFLVTADLMLHVDAGNPASYPGSGSTWYDLTTSGLNVTLYGSPTYSSANGGYIAFTPSSSQYGGTSGTYNSSTALTRWTTEAWHYYTNTFVGNLSAIICSTYAGNVNFALGSPVGGAAGKNLAAAYFAGAWYYTSSSYSLPSVGWYHIVGTYDGTNLKLYVNNVLTQTQASAVTPGFGGGEIRLMRRWDSGDYWGGYLAIARIYKRALSADEVNTNYQVSKARFGLS